MRTSMNSTELLIWSKLRRREVDGWKFRRQQPIGPYLVDFYCPAARLVVEIDGPVHLDEAQWSYDLRRQDWLEANGYRVLRFPVAEVTRSLGDVIATIYEALRDSEDAGHIRRPHRPAAPR